MDRARKIQALQIGVGAGIAAVAVVLLLLLSNVGIQTPPNRSGKTAPTVSTAAATGVGSTAATLNGNLAGVGSAASVAVGFRYWTTTTIGGVQNFTADTKTAAAAFTESLSGLSPGTAYSFVAWALGDGFAQGSVLSFTTLSSPATSPPSVATKAASSVGVSNATLNGALSGLGTASSVTVGFLYGTSSKLGGATNVTVGSLAVAGDFHELVKGLLANKTYYVQAWAMGDGFVSGAVLSFTTSVGGNGNIVPPGWAHAACPNVPSHAVAHGVRARCQFNMTWGEMKKLGLTGDLSSADLSEYRASLHENMASPDNNPGNAYGATTNGHSHSGVHHGSAS